MSKLLHNIMGGIQIIINVILEISEQIQPVLPGDKQCAAIAILNQVRFNIKFNH